MVKMELGSSQSQASSTVTMTCHRVSAYDDLIASMATFQQTAELKGAAYDSAKSYANAVLVPLFQGAILLSEGINDSVGKLPTDYESQVGAESLDSDVLEQQIQSYQNAYDSAKSLYERLSKEEDLDHSAMTEAHSAMASNQAKINELKEKLRKLLDFNGRSSSIFDSIDALKASVEQGIALASRDFSAFNGSFTLPTANQLEWTKKIQSGWKKREADLYANGPSQEFNQKAQQIADETGLTLDEVVDYILYGKEPNKYLKQLQKAVHTGLKYYKGKKFFDGKEITIDDRGRVKLGSQFLYKKDSGHMYRLTKDFKKATDIDMSKTSYARTADGALDFKEASKMGKKQFAESINPLNDFKGWKDASNLSKAGKALGIVGTGLTILGNANSNFDESKGGISNVENWGNFAVDTGVDLGTGAGAAAIGAGIGSFFAPPLGTVVGAGVGFGVNWLASQDWDSNNDKSSLTDIAKDGIKSAWKGIFG